MTLRRINDKALRDRFKGVLLAALIIGPLIFLIVLISENWERILEFFSW